MKISPETQRKPNSGSHGLNDWRDCYDRRPESTGACQSSQGTVTKTGVPEKELGSVSRLSLDVTQGSVMKAKRYEGTS